MNERGDRHLITLERLKEIGCISTSYQAVEFRGNECVSVTELLSWSKSKQARFQGVVVSDDCLWIATLEKIPISMASNVYSSDGETLVFWNKSKRMLFIKKLVDNKLSTIKQIIIQSQQEVKDMAGINLEGVNLDNLGDTVGSEMTAFNDDAVVIGETSGSKASEANKSFIEKMKQQNVMIADNVSIVTANQKDGRSLGFITRTDKAVRLSLRTVKKKGADDKFLLAEDADEAGKRAYKEYKDNNGKVPSVKYLQTETEFVIKQAKPGKIIGMIIKAPVAADKDFSQIINGEASAVNDTEKGMTVKVLPIEYAYMYLINAFDGTIKEDEGIMGPRAAWLKVKGVAVVSKDSTAASAMESIRYSMVLASKSENRKTVLTTGNYIPVKSYVAYSQAEITSGEIEEKLNNNVKMLLKGKQERLNKLTEKSKSLLIGDGDGVKYFAASASERTAIDPVESFDAQGVLASVKIAVRDAKQKKDGGYTYPFVFDTDLTKILGRTDVSPIVNATGLSVEELKTKIDSLSTKTNKNTVRKTVASLDIESIKKYQKLNNKKDIRDITKLLAGVPA